MCSSWPNLLAMGRFWQWLWDRYGPHYSWGLVAAAIPLAVGTYSIFTLMILRFEDSTRYGEAMAVLCVGAALHQTTAIHTGRRWIRPTERWAAGAKLDRRAALEGTYRYARTMMSRQIWSTAVWFAASCVLVGMVAGASGPRLAQYGVLGAIIGATIPVAVMQALAESIMRPLRVALAGESDIGDDLPRSQPSFATHVNVSTVTYIFIYTLTGALVVAISPHLGEPVLCAAVAAVTALVLGLPFAVGLGVAPRLRPVRELAEGADRVAAGDYDQRLPVVQDDDLGVLVASFNRMQAGLAERQRLQAAFGSYVDPALAARLLEQGDEVFTGERREVSVLFLDVRDFTPFAEANTAEDTVTRLNELFAIVVPEVVGAGGHVNKFMGDGAMAVFGAPNHLADHADAAVAVAVAIQRRVAERFDGAVRIGIGINTGVVIAGTIGAAGRLEFAIIGDAANVAARIEQLTKTTGDAILLTGRCADALTGPPPRLVDRGTHALKGKTSATRVYAVTL
jgi:adenylate cyclase